MNKQKEVLPVAVSKDLNLFESKKKQKSGCILNHFENDYNLVLECASKKISLLALLIQKLQLVNNDKTLNQLKTDLQNAQIELHKFTKGSKSNNSLSHPIRSPDYSAKKICSNTTPSVAPQKKYCTINKTYDSQTAQNELSKFDKCLKSDSSLQPRPHPIRSPDFKCELCDNVFGQLSDLKNHSNLVHEGNLQFVHVKPSYEPKIYKCETCGKIFNKSHDYKKHVRIVHEGVRDHKCDRCGKAFGYLKDVQVHIKNIHEGLKEYVCDTCGKEFSTMCILKRHVETVHEGQRKHSCEICGKNFTAKNGLNYHLEHAHKQS